MRTLLALLASLFLSACETPDAQLERVRTEALSCKAALEEAHKTLRDQP